MLIHNKGDIEFVTEFPCLLVHPVCESLTWNIWTTYCIVIWDQTTIFLIFLQSRKFPYWTHCSTPLVCLVIEGGTNTIRNTPHHHYWDTSSLSLFRDTLIFFGTRPHYLFWDTPLIIYSWDTSPLLYLGHIHVFYFWGHKIILFFRDTPHYYFWDNTSILFLGHLHCLFWTLPHVLFWGLPYCYFWNTFYLHCWDTTHQSCPHYIIV